jgi:hypothetical protein
MSKVWRCSYESVRSGVLLVNVFHTVATADVGIGDATADEVRDALNTALTTKYRAILDTGSTLNSLTVRQELDPGDTSIPAESVLTIGSLGTRSVSDSYLPMSLTQLVSLRTNAAVRSGHGRMFMPPPIASSNLSTGGIWSTGAPYWSNVGTFMTELLSTHRVGGIGTGSDLHTVVYSRTRRARGDSEYWFGVSAYIQRPAPHWLRSRSTAP